MAYIYLTIAVICEVVATSSLKATREFTRLTPTLVVITGYLAAFYFLTLSLKTLTIGVAYAIWSGLGIVLIAIFGYIIYREMLDIPAIIGIVLILTGIAVINVFSGTVTH
ncbi:MAG: DMT family transporter [Bacteroidota bacterium]